MKTPALAMQQVYTLSKAAYDGAVDAQQAARAGAVGPRSDRQAAAAGDRRRSADALAAFDKKLEALAAAPPAAGGGRGGRGGGGGGRGAPGAGASPDSLGGASAALAGVMNSLQGADVRPTAVQLTAIARARDGRVTRDGTWTALKTVDLPALNAKLKAAGLPAIAP